MRASSPCGHDRIAGAAARARPALCGDRPARVPGAPSSRPRIRRCAASSVARELGVGDVGEAAPRRDACVPEGLGFPEVADSGDETLVEQRVADLSLLVFARGAAASIAS